MIMNCSWIAHFIELTCYTDFLHPYYLWFEIRVLKHNSCIKVFVGLVLLVKWFMNSCWILDFLIAAIIMRINCSRSVYAAFPVDQITLAKAPISGIGPTPLLWRPTNLPVSQSSPSYPGAQWQVKELIRSKHVAPFLQGLLLHSSSSVKRKRQIESVSIANID